MKLTPSRLRTIALAALSAALIILLLAGHGKPPVRSNKTTGVTTVGRSIAPAATVQTPKKQAIRRFDIDLLRRRISGFISSYYRLSPGDTAADRRRRVEPFASPQLLESLDLTPSKSRATVQAEADGSQMNISVSNGKARVSATADIYIRRPDSGTERYISLSTTSTWRWRAGNWVLFKFN